MVFLSYQFRLVKTLLPPLLKTELTGNIIQQKTHERQNEMSKNKPYPTKIPGTVFQILNSELYPSKTPNLLLQS